MGRIRREKDSSITGVDWNIALSVTGARRTQKISAARGGTSDTATEALDLSDLAYTASLSSLRAQASLPGMSATFPEIPVC